MTLTQAMFATEPLRLDGFPHELQWQGKAWLVPSEKQLFAWAATNTSENPKGKPVPYNHRDSWLVLLGLAMKKEKDHVEKK